jgi:hypothetical protein
MRVTTRVREDVASVLHSLQPPTAASRENCEAVEAAYLKPPEAMP